MARWKKVATALGLCGLLGCAGVEPAVYRAETPAFDLPQYFNGPVQAWGVFQDRSGQVVKRFTVRIDCRWQDGVGTLDEDFTYSDGSKQRRVWTLRRAADGRWLGTADDVVGEAVGQESGNALNWRYTLALPVDGRVWHVQFDDWMFRMDESVVLNRAVMSKWGIRLGEVVLSFRKGQP